MATLEVAILLGLAAVITAFVTNWVNILMGLDPLMKRFPW